MSAMAALAADHDRFGIGANGPPEPIPVNPFDGLKVHLEDTLIEARNFADGEPVTSEAMDNAVKQLIEDLKEGAAAAEALRVEEKAPLDRRIAEIQERFNFYIAPLKNKVPGLIPLAIESLNACRKPWLDKLQADIEAAAKKAREDADAAIALAAAAAREADVGDFSAREAVEELVVTARAAERVATTASKAKVSGLRKTYTAQVNDPRALLLHYWGTKDAPGVNREPLLACLQSMAQQDVDRKVFTIPGVTVIEGTKF